MANRFPGISGLDADVKHRHHHHQHQAQYAERQTPDLAGIQERHGKHHPKCGNAEDDLAGGEME
jgi:hypothetical protein